MDRLRKCLEAVRLKVRECIKYNWHNEPEGDRFRSLEVLYVLGAVRYKPTTKWQRICWNAYLALSVCHFIILVLNATDQIPGKFNLTKATWHAAMVFTACFCFVKDSVLNRHFESIQTTQKFINSKPFGSGDSVISVTNDAACRQKCFQRLQLAVLGLLSTVLIDQIIFNVPVLGIDELFGTPRLLLCLGPKVAKGIHLMFLFITCPLLFSKFCAGTGTICSLLHGFNTEYEIFVRGFDNILDNVYSNIEEEFPSTVKGAPEWKRFQRDFLYWQYLEQRINEQVKQHEQFAENLQRLKPVVKYLFGIIYYQALFGFSPALYVVKSSGMSATSLLLLSGVATQLLECYMWCRIIDSLKDTNAKLELKILDLTTKIPYSEFHRKKYAEMQMTLCIMKTYVRNHEPFSCFGVFPISVEAFTELLHIGYTVFTFLRDMGKKNVKIHRGVKPKRRH